MRRSAEEEEEEEDERAEAAASGAVCVMDRECVGVWWVELGCDD